MQIFAWLILIGSAAFQLVATRLDADESKRKPYYGKEEGTKQLRNEDGSANIGKLWLYAGISWAIAAGLFAAVHFGISDDQFQGAPHLAAAAPLLITGIWRFLIWRGNVQQSKENRQKQIRWRAQVREALAVGDILRFQDLLNIQTEVAGRWYPQWTPWLVVEAGSDQEAFTKLQPVMEAWLAIPDGDLKRVWIDTKYHPK
jgi:hypothetical protein